MNIFFFITSIFFFSWIVRNILFWVALWQLKEYRFDRVSIHLRETSQGRNLIFSYLSIIKWLTIFIYGFVIFNNTLTIPFQILVFLIYALQSYFVFKEISQSLTKTPVFTFKAILIILLTFLTLLLFYLFPLTDRFAWLLFLDKIATLIILIFVFLLSFLTEMYRDWRITKAIEKIRKHKNLLVIGITGSYGKSSTKDYIAQVLEKKFKVLKTKGTNNTPIGIANTIISGLNNDIEVFIVEMGAYKKGEITQMCQIVRPKIGILTAINHQHLPLFGSLEKTMEAKYELIESLPGNGLALFNGNNENAYMLFKKAKKRKILYSSSILSKDTMKNDPILKESSIYAYNIVTKKTSVLFDVTLKNKSIRLSAPLIGKHNIEDILPAVYLANYLGMKDEEVKKAVNNLLPLPKTMIRYEKENEITLVDDSFNANPNAVLAALTYMKIYKNKRILVLQPMIELGRSANQEHYNIAKEISKISNYLLLTNNNYYKYIFKGINDGGGNCVVKIGNPLELAQIINNIVGKGDIVLFEGKESAFVFDRLLNSED